MSSTSTYLGGVLLGIVPDDPMRNVIEISYVLNAISVRLQLIEDVLGTSGGGGGVVNNPWTSDVDAAGFSLNNADTVKLASTGGDAGVSLRLDGYQNYLYIVATPSASNDAGIIFRTGVGGGSETERVRIAPNGNVGIGFTDPGPHSRVTVDGGDIQIRTGNILLLRPSGNDWDMRLQAVSQRLDILSGGALGNPIASFVHGGNIGIGTASPGTKLHVLAPTGGAPPTSGTTTPAILRVARGDGGNCIDFGSYTAPPYAVWIQSSDFTTLGANYPISLNPNGGNVGIGTTNPTQKLSVVSPNQSDIQILLTNDPANYYTIGRRAIDGWLVFSCNQFGATGYDFRTDGGTRSSLRIENNGNVAMQALPTSDPGAGSKKLWCDTSAGNVVKWAI